MTSGEVSDPLSVFELEYDTFYYWRFKLGEDKYTPIYGVTTQKNINYIEPVNGGILDYYRLYNIHVYTKYGVRTEGQGYDFCKQLTGTRMTTEVGNDGWCHYRYAFPSFENDIPVDSIKLHCCARGWSRWSHVKVCLRDKITGVLSAWNTVDDSGAHSAEAGYNYKEVTYALNPFNGDPWLLSDINNVEAVARTFSGDGGTCNIFYIALSIGDIPFVTTLPATGVS
jgi:hypothetical protein